MKNIAILSLGSGGTMGHMTLSTHLSNMLIKSGNRVTLISDSDYSSFLDKNIRNLDLLEIKKQRHIKTVGGNLSYKYKVSLINILKSRKIEILIFSTFYDLELVREAKKLGIICFLISYPLRDSHRSAIISRKYYSLFDKCFTLEDIYKLNVNYPNEVMVKPFFSKSNNKKISSQVRSILFTCGGGGRPSARLFSKIIKKIVPEILKSYIHIKIIIIKGNSNINIINKRVNILDWSNDFINLLDKSDLIISEAGYYTLLDLISLRKPAILIPGERRIDNQELRAVHFELLGLGKFYFPTENTDSLLREIKNIVDCPEILKKYSHNYKNLKYISNSLDREILKEINKY